VVDARNPDFSLEPGDAKSSEKAPLAGTSAGYRPGAYNLPYDRVNSCMDLGLLPERCGPDTPIISHCGGGGRGQKAKDFLLANGYTNVLNGGGPEDAECWHQFGDK
jgi:rhodanese-related sulfurtransferase